MAWSPVAQRVKKQTADRGIVLEHDYLAPHAVKQPQSFYHKKKQTTNLCHLPYSFLNIEFVKQATSAWSKMCLLFAFLAWSIGSVNRKKNRNAEGGGQLEPS